MSYILFLSSISMPASSGFTIVLIMLTIIPISLKKFLVLYFLSIISYIANGAILLKALGKNKLFEIVITSGSFFVIFLIYLLVNAGNY